MPALANTMMLDASPRSAVHWKDGETFLLNGAKTQAIVHRMGYSDLKIQDRFLSDQIE